MIGSVCRQYQGRVGTGQLELWGNRPRGFISTLVRVSCLLRFEHAFLAASRLFDVSSLRSYQLDCLSDYFPSFTFSLISFISLSRNSQVHTSGFFLACCSDGQLTNVRAALLHPRTDHAAVTRTTCNTVDFDCYHLPSAQHGPFPSARPHALTYSHRP